MTRNIGGKGIASQGLPNGLCATASYASCQFSICDGRSPWHIEQFDVNPTLKLRNLRRIQHRLLDIHSWPRVLVLITLLDLRC